MTASIPVPPVRERFENLLFSPLRVHKMLGRRSPGEVRYEESEQSDARRELLRIEKVAIKTKSAQARSQASYADKIRDELHAHLVAEIEEHIASPGKVFTDTLSLGNDVIALLDILATPTASVSRLTPHITAMPWMSEALLTLVNAPDYRRKDARGKVIIVDSVKTALSFLGIENVRLLIPQLIMKRALPKITDPYPQVKQFLHDYSLGTGVAARELAAFTTIKPYDAFVLGILSNLGRSALTRLYFRMFDQVKQTLLRQAQQEKCRDKHDALIQLSPSANYLIALQQQFAPALTAQIVGYMELKHLTISQTLRAAGQTSVCSFAPAEVLLRQAQRYAQVRMLAQHRFISKEEAAHRLGAVSYPTGALSVLKTINIFAFPWLGDQDRTTRKAS